MEIDTDEIAIPNMKKRKTGIEFRGLGLVYFPPLRNFL